ncbi:carbamate kinase [Streptomyces sp. NPDC005708]|uniref:carbamate kinase n=1 Tax=Streptomyces sp. NPDC005708 TaxID=3154564 RepID=UPI0033DE5754
MPKTAVVALGGNALTLEGQSGTYVEQELNALHMAETVCSLRDAGWNVVLVHGNGPQVGNLAIQQEQGEPLVPQQPLFCLGSMTQGQIGSLLTLALRRVGGSRIRDVASLVTHVVVEADDPAMDRPTKPIGPFFDADQATLLANQRGWRVAEDAGRGYRRVVPSPEPTRIVEAGVIKTLVDSGVIVVAAGGGGVPVVRQDKGYTGVDAVIDKDYAAQQLATALKADALVLVTGVERVLLDFGTPQQRPVREMTAEEAERHLGDGQFPEGSMGPKVRAALRFIRNGGETAVITTPQLVQASLDADPKADAEVGTRIVTSRTQVGATR